MSVPVGTPGGTPLPIRSKTREREDPGLRPVGERHGPPLPLRGAPLARGGARLHLRPARLGDEMRTHLS